MVTDGSGDDRTRSFTALAAGTKVSHYTIVSKIGAGGMGEVYLADDATLDRKVALKFLPQHMCDDEAARTRFMREAKAAAKLDHKNIVPIYEVGEFQGQPFFAMANIEGSSLREIIRLGKLTTAEAIQYTMQICEGLHKAHESGVVHRDVKPGNIIIDTENQARLVDFGLATVAGEEKLTKTGSTVGTMGYMSPEQVSGKKVDHRSDIFSVGVILYEMLAGHRPFEGDNDAAVIKAITDSTPEPIARYKSGTSADLQQIVDKALAKDPSHRYQHADGMLADLRRLDVAHRAGSKAQSSMVIVSGIVIVIAIVAALLYGKFDTAKEPLDDEWDNSVAVLIFRNLGGDEDQDIFCEGMAEEIISRLTTIERLKVPGTQSVLRFTDTNIDLSEIGRQLKVRHVLTGSVRQIADKIRVSAQLIRIEDDASIWAEKYDRDFELSAIFSIQDDISRSIANVLEATLVGTEEAFLARRGTENIEAYNEYVRGRHFWRKRSQEGLKTAIGHFERAVELDPDFAVGWSGLADGWCMLGRYLFADQVACFAKADTFSLRALELDPNSAEAQASRGCVLYYEKRFAEAEIHFAKAVKLNPGYPWGQIWYGAMLWDIGRDEEAETRIATAYKLDPLSPAILGYLAYTDIKKGNLATAERYSLAVLELEPSHSNSFYNLTSIYLASKDTVKALETAEKMVTQIPDDWKSYDNMGRLLWDLGRLAEAKSWYEKAVEVSPHLAATHEALGWFLVSSRFQDFKEAQRQFQLAIEIDPRFASPHLGLGFLLLRKGQTAEAGKHYRLAVELNPFDARTHRHYGRYLEFSAGDVKQAIEYYEKSVQLSPLYDWGFESLSLAYEKVGRIDDALVAMNKAIEIAPVEADHIVGRGSLLLRLGHLDDAIADYRHYLEYKPNNAVALRTLGDIYTLQRRYTTADSVYGLISALPDSIARSSGSQYAVRPLLYQGKFRQALEYLEKGMERDNGRITNSDANLERMVERTEAYRLFLRDAESALKELARAKQVHAALPSKNMWMDAWITSVEAATRALAGQINESVKIFEDAIAKTDRDDVSLLNTYNFFFAQAYIVAGRFQDATPLMEKCAERNPGFSNRLWLGVCYLGVNRTNDAVEVLEAAVSRYDQNRLASWGESVLGHYYLAQAYEGAGRTQEAIERYETFLDIWKNADAGLESVEDAKTRLARLKEAI